MSKDKVVDIERFKKKKDEHVFTHTCGSQLFYLHDDQTLQCRNCQQFLSTLIWGETE